MLLRIAEARKFRDKRTYYVLLTELNRRLPLGRSRRDGKTLWLTGSLAKAELWKAIYDENYAGVSFDTQYKRIPAQSQPKELKKSFFQEQLKVAREYGIEYDDVQTIQIIGNTEVVLLK